MNHIDNGIVLDCPEYCPLEKYCPKRTLMVQFAHGR